MSTTPTHPTALRGATTKETTMSLKTLLCAVGALALAACADPTQPTRVDPEMLVRPPLPTPLVSRIAFTNWLHSNADIWVINADGNGLVGLTTHPAVDEEPAWSLDMSKIAFASNRSGSTVAYYFQIWRMNADGSFIYPLTHTNSDNMQPAWSPDGAKIAFISDRSNGTNYEIWRMNADGSGSVNLTPTTGFNQFHVPILNGHPTWSPDGAKIAFHSNRQGYYEIYVMDARDGSGIASLGRGTSPAWSPDGSKIAFTCDGGDIGLADICLIVDAKNTASPIVRLTTYAGYDGQPAWSPDGSKIAFTSKRDGDSAIYVMDATFGDNRPVTRLTTGSNPSWARPLVLSQQ
jgi:Tol biopolymer transport system component